MVIPYGVDSNGAWIDPTNTDITNTGPPRRPSTFRPKLTMSQAPSSTFEEGATYWLINSCPGMAEQSTCWISGERLGRSESYNPGDLVSYRAPYSANEVSKGVTPTAGPDWSLVPQEYAVIPGNQRIMRRTLPLAR